MADDTYTITVTDGDGAVLNEATASSVEGAALAAQTLWDESLPFVDSPAILPRRACVPMRVTITLDEGEDDGQTVVYSEVGRRP